MLTLGKIQYMIPIRDNIKKLSYCKVSYWIKKLAKSYEYLGIAQGKLISYCLELCAFQWEILAAHSW